MYDTYVCVCKVHRMKGGKCEHTKKWHTLCALKWRWMSIRMKSCLFLFSALFVPTTIYFELDKPYWLLLNKEKEKHSTFSECFHRSMINANTIRDCRYCAIYCNNRIHFNSTFFLMMQFWMSLSIPNNRFDLFDLFDLFDAVASEQIFSALGKCFRFGFNENREKFPCKFWLLDFTDTLTRPIKTHTRNTLQPLFMYTS